MTETRKHKGRIMAVLFLSSTIFAVLCLATLLFSVLDQTAGYVLIEYKVDPADVFPLDANGNPVPIDSLDSASLVNLLKENLGARRIKALSIEQSLETRQKKELVDLAIAEILEPEVVRTWNFSESILSKKAILKWAVENGNNGDLTFRYWLSPHFLKSSQSSNALFAGIRSAIIGSVLTITLTLFIAFPFGLGAALYLEEYAPNNALNRIIKINIYNLGGVPSIIYGMLGLGIFVRWMSPVTSGALFGIVDSSAAGDGRTILSAGLTLSLLILPTIIINAQEALRAVPRSLRESGFALGATKWQVIASHVLPASMDRILTGTVLAVSRGIGESAPLILVGASTFLTKDPTGIFSRFTTLPIQIYQWTSRPQAEFRNVAAAAIITLIILLMSINATAIVLRNKFSSEKRG